MTSRKLFVAVSLFAVGVVSAGLAGAAGVVVQPGQAPLVVQPSQPAPTVVVPQQQPSTTVVVPSTPATVQAGDIAAQETRAQTIYANKMKSRMVRGAVHQSDAVTIKDTKGDIKLRPVTGGVIYADTIKANSVVADNIYVRNIERD